MIKVNRDKVTPRKRTPEDRRCIEMLNDWPDGTPKSFGNAFTAHWHHKMLDMASATEPLVPAGYTVEEQEK